MPDRKIIKIMDKGSRVPLLFVPGINGSDSLHWQSIWQSRRSNAVRIAPTDWKYPSLSDWMHALERAIGECASPPIAVAHSLGSILVAHWASTTRQPGLIRGAFLVAPPDPNHPHFPAEAPTFQIATDKAFGRPCVVIASSDDPYSSIESACDFANKLKAGFVAIDSMGHINSESEIGEWSQGFNYLKCFAAGISITI